MQTSHQDIAAPTNDTTGIVYSSYPEYESSSSIPSNMTSSTYPGAPSTGGTTLSPDQSLMTASAGAGSLGTTAAIIIAILGVLILGGAAYGINSVYSRGSR